MSNNKTRREFLMTAGAGVAAGLLLPRIGLAEGGNPPASGQQQLHIRKNVVSTDAQSDLESLRKGVGEMKKLIATKPDDPRGWILQAFIHGDCGRFTLCQHGNWFFPPWHRSYLYYFEQLIQFFSGNPGFALPYWDWSRTISVPASFYGTDNPLDDNVSIQSSCSGAPTAGRGRSVTETFSQSDLDTYVGPTVINNILQNPDYTTFGGGSPGTGALKQTPHNFVHRWVGGRKYSNMVQTFSPLDPIFWMHHCNIDRLYSNWLSRPRHLPPQEPEWQEKSFNDFYDSNGNQVGKQFTCGMTVKSEVMGYVYDDLNEFTQLFAIREKAPLSGKQNVLGSVVPAKSAAQSGILSFASEAPSTTRMSFKAAAMGATDYVVRLRIEGVKTPQQQDTGVFVFLGAGINKDTPISAPGYIGSFTFFDGQGNKAHAHGTSKNVLLNATEAFKRLYGDTALPEHTQLVVSIVTKPLFDGGDSFATVEEINPERVQIDIVNLNA